MAAARSFEITGRNRILEALPRRDYARLRRELRPISLAVRQDLYVPDALIEEVYFPLDSVLSIVLKTRDGRTGEVATIGNEGMLGVAAALGSSRGAYRAFAQIGGQALCMEADTLRRELEGGGAFAERIYRYTYALLQQISQGVVCNIYHSVQVRMCRWLLMTHDRVGKDEFPLTQDFLAQMLGVRRPSVSVVAGVLQREGMIDYRRGWITIRDRERLEGCECGCYQLVREQFESILSRRDRSPRRRAARKARRSG